MFPTFIFCLLFTAMDYSSPARRAAVQVVFDVGVSKVGESDAWRNINGRKSVYVELTSAFLLECWQQATNSGGALFLKPL